MSEARQLRRELAGSYAVLALNVLVTLLLACDLVIDYSRANRENIGRSGAHADLLENAS